VISRRSSCSGAPDELAAGVQSISRGVVSLFVHQGTLLLCAAFPSLSEQIPLSVLLSLLTVCALSFLSPLPKHFSNILISLFLSITTSLSFTLSLLLLSATRLSDTPPPFPTFAVRRPTEAIGTNGLGGLPGSTDFYRKQPGTAAAGMMRSQGVRRAGNIQIQPSVANSKTVNDLNECLPSC